MDKNQYTESNLIQFGIFQLREIARSVGVHLPTTYKKDDLIQKIIQVTKGEIKPFVAKNKKGRPPKNFIGYNGAWKKQEMTETEGDMKRTSWEQGSWIKKQQNEFQDGFRVGIPEEDIEFGIIESSSSDKIIEGVVFCEPNGWGTLHIGGLSQVNDNQVAIIPPNIMVLHDIRLGDCLKCKSVIREQTIIVSEIVTINGYSVNDIKRQNFAELDTIMSDKVIPLWENKKLIFTRYLTPIGKGQRVLIRGERASGKTLLLSEIAKECADLGLYTIFIAVDKRPEDKLELPDSIEYGFSAFDMIPFRQMYLIDLAVARAKRLCEEGKDVVLLIDDFISVLRAYNYCLPQSNPEKTDCFDLNAIVALKKIMASGKNTSQGGSITLIGCMGNGRDDEERKITDLIDDLCNCHIETSKELYQANMSCYILPNSITNNAYQLLENENIQIAQNIRSESFGKNLVDIVKIYSKNMGY